jgi:hypothetical protein
MFDESESDEAFRDKLFHWITEPTIRLRVAYSDGKDIQSHTNFILASNKPDAAPIEVADRRFTVAPRQPDQIEISQEEVEVQISEELTQFARYLLAYEVDHAKATRPLQNQAKLDMREASRDSISVFIEAIQTGDLVYFLNILDASRGDESSLSGEEAIKRWADGVNRGKTPVSLAELHNVYKMISKSQIAVAKFMVMLIKRGIEKPTTVNIADRSTQGIQVEWKSSARQLAAYKDVIGKVVAKAVDDPRGS